MGPRWTARPALQSLVEDAITPIPWGLQDVQQRSLLWEDTMEMSLHLFLPVSISIAAASLPTLTPFSSVLPFFPSHLPPSMAGTPRGLGWEDSVKLPGYREAL